MSNHGQMRRGRIARHLRQFTRSTFLPGLFGDAIVWITNSRSRTSTYHQISLKLSSSRYQRFARKLKIFKYIEQNWKYLTVFWAWTTCVMYLYTAATGDNRLGVVILLYTIDALLSLNVLITLFRMKEIKNASLTRILTGTGDVVLNLIMVMPFEILLYPVFGMNHYILVLRANRLIAVKYLFYYWKITCMRAVKNPLPSHLPQKCLYFLLLSMSLGITSGAALLYFLHNWERNHVFNKLENSEKAILFTDCFIRIMGLRLNPSENTPSTQPLHSIKIFVITIITLGRSLVYISILTNLYTKIYSKTINYPQFWSRYNKLMVFLKVEKTTNLLLCSAKRYLELHWTKMKGQYEPEIMNTLPFHLRAAVINYSHGKYLYFSPYFHGCSLNFLRQISTYMKSIVLYSGDVIVVSGSNEKCLYLMKSGCIVVNNKRKQCTVDVLYKWDSFGLSELLNNTTFQCDYVAYSRVHLLCLYFKDWEHLIPFFQTDFDTMNSNLTYQSDFDSDNYTL